MQALIGLLPIVVVILLAWLAATAIRKAGNKNRPIRTDAEPNGIGGWLLFLIVGLMFLGPLMAIGRIAGDIASAEAQYPNLAFRSQWVTYKTATWWATCITIATSFYTGLVLVRGRTMAAVQKAKMLLWIVGPGMGLASSLIVPLIAFGKAEFNPEMLGALIAAILVAAIWTAYLSRSKRVNATYGETTQEVILAGEVIPQSDDGLESASEAVRIPWHKKFEGMATTTLGAAAFLAFFGFGLFQMVIGYMGIAHEWGNGWAIGAVFGMFFLRISFPFTVGSFFYALNVWEWHWAFAALFALPGLLFMVPAILTAIVGGAASIFKR